MPTVTFAAPVLPGRLEAWRRFTQELQGTQRVGHAESRRRLGMSREVSYLQQTPQGDLVIISFDARDPETALRGMATSTAPFDRWFREKVLDLHGLDLAQAPAAPPSERVFDWRDAADDAGAAEANKAIYRRYIEEVWNQGNLAAMDRYFSEDHVDHAAPPGQQPGLAGLKPTFAMFHAAFTDMLVTIRDLIAEGDKMVALVTFQGIHTGTFFGIPPTGRRVSVTQTHTLRYAGGKMAEHWSNSDDLAMMRQLSAIPELSHA
jgi:predicted ester cyclase